MNTMSSAGEFCGWMSPQDQASLERACEIIENEQLKLHEAKLQRRREAYRRRKQDRLAQLALQGATEQENSGLIKRTAVLAMMPEIVERTPLQKVTWATVEVDRQGRRVLRVDGYKPRPKQMADSGATARELLLVDEKSGLDEIAFAEGTCVEEHIHGGPHALIVTEGEGTLEYWGERHTIVMGQAYGVPPWVPHAIYADRGMNLVLLSVGFDWRPPDSEERMIPVGKHPDAIHLPPVLTLVPRPQAIQ